MQTPMFKSSKLNCFLFVRNRGIINCHSRLPVASSRHITIPPLVFSSRWSCRELSLVPMNTFPPATVGLPYVCEPSFTAHFTLRALAMSALYSPESSFFVPPGANVSGRLFLSETIFRSLRLPHCGQSSACRRDDPAAKMTTPVNADKTIRSRDIAWLLVVVIKQINSERELAPFFLF